MDHAVAIEALLDLAEQTTSVKRINIRDIYLAQFGREIIPACVRRFVHSRKADFRADLLGFVLRYGTEDLRVVTMAILALRDPSQKVRQSACRVLAYARHESARVALSETAQGTCVTTADAARRALECLDTGNHNRFFPQYSSWGITVDDPRQPRRDAVDRYVVRQAPELVPAIAAIFGSVYGCNASPTPAGKQGD